MKPKVAIKLDTVTLDKTYLKETVLLDKTYLKETVLPEDGFYRYLYQPFKQHGDQKRWATYLKTSGEIWSKNTYWLDQVVQSTGSRVIYYLQDGPNRAFLREELMHVSEDTQVSPDWVSEWK